MVYQPSANTVQLESGLKVGKHPLVIQDRKSFEQQRRPLPKLCGTWEKIQTKY